MYTVDLDEGKYTVIEDIDNGEFKALRNGLEWRDLIGDKLVLALVNKIKDLEEQINQR